MTNPCRKTHFVLEFIKIQQNTVFKKREEKKHKYFLDITTRRRTFNIVIDGAVAQFG
jgi:hypothetical protein